MTICTMMILNSEKEPYIVFFTLMLIPSYMGRQYYHLSLVKILYISTNGYISTKGFLTIEITLILIIYIFS